MSEIKIYTGEEARKIVREILAGVQYSGNGVHYPVMTGTAGYFREVTGHGNTVYSAFDNCSGDCWCEDFKTQEVAEKWCRGEISADEARDIESNVEKIILYKDSFSEFLKGRVGDTPNQMPPYVQFNGNGECYIDMFFSDGYAIDTNPHGLGFYDRVGLYYPTVVEVARSAVMQVEIEDYTGRRWAEGSDHEKIFDIALVYGEAGRVKCPQNRYDAAVKAVVERAADPSAKAFSPEQRATIELAVNSNGYKDYPDWKETFLDGLFAVAQQKMKGVPVEWAHDAHQELKGLAHGKVRDEGQGLHL